MDDSALLSIVNHQLKRCSASASPLWSMVFKMWPRISSYCFRSMVQPCMPWGRVALKMWDQLGNDRAKVSSFSRPTFPFEGINFLPILFATARATISRIAIPLSMACPSHGQAILMPVTSAYSRPADHDRKTTNACMGVSARITAMRHSLIFEGES